MVVPMHQNLFKRLRNIVIILLSWGGLSAVITVPEAGLAQAELSVKISKIVDADSLKSGKLNMRLYGIDAPEKDQICTNHLDKKYKCGIKATHFLSQLIDKQAILTCEIKDIDRYKRLVVRCFQQGQDIAQLLVQAGWAVAYTRYSKLYVQDQQIAQTNRAGIWKGDFVFPEQWRQRKK